MDSVYSAIQAALTMFGIAFAISMGVAVVVKVTSLLLSNSSKGGQ